MTEIGFYHLTRTRLEKALPPLLARTLDRGERAVIRATTPERVAFLDDQLWSAEEYPWLPHGSARSGDADLQPIWLTAGEDAANNAAYLFLVDGATCDTPENFTRIFDLFDGADDAATAAARARYASARKAGHAVTYYKQGPRGWEKG